MSYIETRKAITDVLKTYAGYPPLFAENTNVPDATQKNPWTRWSIRFADARASDVGSKNQRVIGTLYFQHFIPEEYSGGGTIDAYSLGDKIAILFNEKRSVSGAGATLGVVCFRRAVVKYVGKSNGFVQHNITIDFFGDSPAVNAA